MAVRLTDSDWVSLSRSEAEIITACLEYTASQTQEDKVKVDPGVNREDLVRSMKLLADFFRGMDPPDMAG